MTNENVYLKRGDSVKGPLPKNQLRSLLLDKKLRPTDHVSSKPSGPWIPITDYLGNEGAISERNKTNGQSSTTDSGTTILIISLLGFLFPFVWPIAWILGKKYVSDHDGHVSSSNGNYGRIIGKTMTLIFFVPMFLLIPFSLFQAANHFDIEQHGPREFSDFTTGEKIPRAFRDVFAKAKTVYRIDEGMFWDRLEKKHRDSSAVYYMSPDLGIIASDSNDKNSASYGKWAVYDGRTVKDKDHPGFNQDTGFKNTYYKPSIEKTDDGYQVEFSSLRDTGNLRITMKTEITMGKKDGTVCHTATTDPNSPIYADFGRKPNPPIRGDRIPISVEQIR